MNDNKDIHGHEPEGALSASTPEAPPARAAKTSLKSLLRTPNYVRGADPDPFDQSGDNEAAPFNYKDSQSVGQYLFGSSYSDPALQGKGAGPENWTSHTKSRIFVRLFSRGLMGATFYTLAHRWAPGQLEGYSAQGGFDRAKPLQHLARGFDIIYGKPIQFYVKNFYKFSGKTAEEAAKMAEKATTFRVHKNFDLPQNGRSLGAEIVGMSTDFAAGSTGDAWGRQIANALDPNTRNAWEDEKDGHIHWDIFAKESAKTAWRIFSKNQGEDWAVALPYVYQMRFQRVALDRMYRGFGVSSDYGLNGGSWRVNQHGQLVDSYAKAGALDLQTRFTGYNWYTLMYRDLYDNVATRIKHYRETGEFSSAETGTGHQGVLDNTAHAFRYVTKSAIKAFIYMTPAVPFFWITRTPQTKPHGMGVEVNSQTGVVSKHPLNRSFDPFMRENTRGVFDRALSPFGKACFKTSEALNAGFRALKVMPDEKTRYNYKTPTFAETWVNSSVSYTPYMIAKAETALRWDRPKGADGMNGMDRAIYRFLDGINRLNIGEVGAGLSDMRREIVRPPSNRAIQAKRSQDRERMANESPQNTVSDIQEQPAAQAHTAPPHERNAQEKTSWKHQIQADFVKNPFPDQGATIH